jgi:peptidoglycan hydrolase-like protein with peptidoglycan-binding domain
MNHIISFLKSSLQPLLISGVALAMLCVVGTPLSAQAQTSLYRQLEIGSTGSDVSVLQTFLAQQPNIYPQGLVTGYFGPLTKAAVMNFQARNNISAIGRVGPETLSIINAQVANGMIGGADVSAPIIGNLNATTNNNTATVTWNTNEPAHGVLYYSSTPFTMYEQGRGVIISGSTASSDSSLRYSQNITVSGLQRNTTYYYLAYATDALGNVNITWPTTFLTTY